MTGQPADLHPQDAGDGVPSSSHRLPRLLQWTATGRALVFALAASSIWCLLAEMYHLIEMRTFFYAILLPASVLLYGIAVLDQGRGQGRLWRAVMIGTIAGLIGALAYDIFRLPFVYSSELGLNRIGIPYMPLFKVFPRFGALILGQPVEQEQYSLMAQAVGWSYHFSNGATFGVMFAALVGDSKQRYAGGLWWAVLMAVGIEACLLLSPYTRFFSLSLSWQFVIVTLAAHVVFGLGMGWWYSLFSKRWVMPSDRIAKLLPA
jgi:hypothetical protein